MSCVVLYVTEGCTLCERAREILRALGHDFREASDDAYVFRVPVVEVDGHIVAEGVVAERPIRRALRTARRPR